MEFDTGACNRLIATFVTERTRNGCIRLSIVIEANKLYEIVFIKGRSDTIRGLHLADDFRERLTDCVL